jgi:hypothetical protein
MALSDLPEEEESDDEEDDGRGGRTLVGKTGSRAGDRNRDREPAAGRHPAFAESPR